MCILSTDQQRAPQLTGCSYGHVQSLIHAQYQLHSESRGFCRSFSQRHRVTAPWTSGRFIVGPHRPRSLRVPQFPSHACYWPVGEPGRSQQTQGEHVAPHKGPQPGTEPVNVSVCFDSNEVLMFFFSLHSPSRPAAGVSRAKATLSSTPSRETCCSWQ